jgi:hypothetical protein
VGETIRTNAGKESKEAYFVALRRKVDVSIEEATGSDEVTE